ncbi:MAG: hypothetical protein HY687_05825 [Chloroflexi bacterium]|nr:hypothetical protein [Chloroflexota bacterium]
MPNDEKKPGPQEPPAEGEATRQTRRERKQRKKRERLPQHGKSLARVYRDAVLKRAQQAKEAEEKGRETKQP